MYPSTNSTSALLLLTCAKAPLEAPSLGVLVIAQNACVQFALEINNGRGPRRLKNEGK